MVRGVDIAITILVLRDDMVHWRCGYRNNNIGIEG